MQFPVKYLGEHRLCEVSFARESDVGDLKDWAKSVRSEQSPMIRDSLEYAQIIDKWWHYYSRKGRLANNIRESTMLTTDNPHAEVAMCLVAHAVWYPEHRILGAALFRRTWSNAIFLDYMATHPLATRTGDSRVSGTGTGLLYGVASIAHALGAKKIWGQTTPISAQFYARTFKLEQIDDLLVVPEAKFKEFKRIVDVNLAEHGIVDLTLAEEG